MKIVLGTRGSRLALTQSGMIADALRSLGHEVDLLTVTTHGDVTTGSLASQGGTGVFAAALREALLSGRCDLAVHSFKDLPTAPVKGLVIAAIPAREDPGDVLVARGGVTLDALPHGARVGTGSPRRAAQLRALRPDLTLVEIRGNVGTRIARALGSAGIAPDLDAVVLAAAGLSRLGLDVSTVPLSILPAAAQGALALECRLDDPAVRTAVRALDDPSTRFAVTAERAVLAGLDAGCAAPVGAHAVVGTTGVVLSARVLDPDGTSCVEASRACARCADPDDAPDAANTLGRLVAADLLARGASKVTQLGASRDSRLEDFHDDRALWAPGTTTELVGRRVLLPRSDGALGQALRDAGAEVTAAPLTRTVPVPFPRLPRAAHWVVFTSPTAVRLLLDLGYNLRELGYQVAAVGPATRRLLQDAGLQVGLVPTASSSAEELARVFPPGEGRVLIPGSELGKPDLAKALRAKGWTVMSIPVYTTATIERAPAGLTEAWTRGDFDAVLVTAGSVVDAVVTLLGLPPKATHVVAFGRPSAAAATGRGLKVDAVAATQDGPGVVRAVADALASTHLPEGETT